MFNGKTDYKWAIFNSYVKLPEGTGYFHTPTLAPTNQWGPALAPMAVFGALQAPRSHGTPGRIAVIAVVLSAGS